MSWLARFLVYNLLLSLGAGIFAWLVVLGALRLLKVRSSALSFCFLSLPVLKTLLILLGVGLALPWPAALFESWHRQAVPTLQALPLVLAWAALLSTGYVLILHRARRAALDGARPAGQADPRLAGIYAGVLERFQKMPCPECSDDLCGTVELKTHPELLITGKASSPLALVEGGTAAILFPAGLAACLDDDELAGALAHELAHFYLRRPGWCSAGTLQKLALVSPLALLLEESMHRQEEKACDEQALAILGQPALYAGMLTKSYRYARQQAGRAAVERLQVLPRLVGFRPLLSERVEAILRPALLGEGRRQSGLVIWLVWGILFALLFFSISVIPS